MQNLLSFTRGLAIDPEPSKQPPGTYRFGKNGIFTAGQHSYEKGFTDMGITFPYAYNGHAAAGDIAVVFLTNNVHSVIGMVDLKAGTYTTLFDDTARTDKLNFNSAAPVHGELSYNYKGEVVAAFHDANNYPRYFNTAHPEYIETIDDMRLQPVAPIPSMVISVQSGGLLQPGAYFIAIALGQTDGSMTQTLTVEGPAIIGQNDVGKALLIQMTNISNRFEKVVLSVIRKAMDGEISCYVLPEVSVVQGAATAIYDGVTSVETTTLETIITPPVYYTRCNHMTVLNDYLYLGGMQEQPEPVLQSYASLITADWKSTAGVTPGTRTFMHEEAIALYVVFTRADGPKSRAYSIAGPVPNGYDLTNDTTDGINKPKYQTDPVPAAFDAVAKTGSMCAWRNETERYPDTAEFSGADLPGAINTRNELVRHFRFPSIRWCKANLYASSADYGVKWLDSLSLIVKNILIPPGWTGYEIYYAKRNPGNSLVQGNTLLQLNAKGAGETANIQSTGGNWDAVFSNNPTEANRLYVDPKEVRLLPFDALYNRFAIAGSFLSFQLKMRTNNVSAAFVEDGAVGTSGAKNGPIAILLDNMLNSVTASTVPHAIKKLETLKYVNNNTNLERWINQRQETALVGTLTSAVSGITVHLLRSEPQQDYIPAGSQRPYAEDTYLVSIIGLKSNLYNNFNNQILVKAGTGSGTSLEITAGDAYISEYTYHAYGRNNKTGNGYSGGQYGIITIRRFVCETIANLSERYETVGNIHSKYWPLSPLTPSAEGTDVYINLFNTLIDPNQFGYSPALNAVNDLVQNVIYSDLVETLYVYPNRIHRAGKLSRANKYRSWRTLAPLDYYETSKNHGPITNLAGFGDKLLIHMRDALYATINNTILKTQDLSVTLGAGDIFQIEPEELQPDVHGIGGLQHKFAALMTPAGYVFYDNKAKTPFIYNDKLTNLSNLLLEFFQSLPDIPLDNPITGSGILAGYDPRHKRILFGFYLPKSYNYQPYAGSADIPSLNVNDVVLMYGKPFKFKGVNTSIYSCTAPPTCPKPEIAGLAPTVTIENDDLLIDAFTTDIEATSVTVVPAGVATAVKTGTLTWELRRVTSVVGVYNLTLFATNACGNGTPVNTTVTINAATTPCLPPAVIEILPGTSAVIEDASPTNTYLASIQYNQSGLTLSSSTANLVIVQSGAFAYIYALSGRTAGTFSGTITAENGCGDVDTVFNVTVVADIVEGTPIEISGYDTPGVTCPDFGTGTPDTVFKLGSAPLVHGDIIYQTAAMTTPEYAWARIIEVITGKLFSVNQATGEISDLSTLCVI